MTYADRNFTNQKYNKMIALIGVKSILSVSSPFTFTFTVTSKSRGVSPPCMLKLQFASPPPGGPRCQGGSSGLLFLEGKGGEHCIHHLVVRHRRLWPNINNKYKQCPLPLKICSLAKSSFTGRTF